MTGDNLFRVANGGEVDAGIPAKKEIEIDAQADCQFVRDIGERPQQGSNAGGVEHRRKDSADRRGRWSVVSCRFRKSAFDRDEETHSSKGSLRGASARGWFAEEAA